MSLAEAVWPYARAGDALVAVSEAVGFETRREPTGAPPEGPVDDAWLEDAGRWLGVEVRPVSSEYPELQSHLRDAAPALIRLEHGLLAAVRARRGSLLLLRPDGLRVEQPIEAVARAVSARAAVATAPQIDGILAAAGLPGQRQGRVRDALMNTLLKHRTIDSVLLVRRPVDAPLAMQARELRVGVRLAGVLSLHLLGSVGWVASWWTIGQAILGGRLESGWLGAWGLMLGTSLIARVGANWVAGRLAIDAAAALRLRLLAGALRLPADLLRSEGVGRSLGRVFESTALETLAVAGGFTALFALLELVIVALVLGAGSSGLLLLGLLALTLAAAVAGIRGYVSARRAWTEERLAITHDLIESMSGHATRLVQQPASERHTLEDQALARYLRRSEELDRRVAWLQAVIPRGWLLLATLGLAPALVQGSVEIAALAVAFGGILLAYAALSKIGDATTRLTDAAIAWRAVAPLVAAGGQRPVVPPPALAHAPASANQPLATLRGVVFKPTRSTVAVLDGCDLVLEEGARVMLEGASGSGKSTLAQVLGGLRRPDAGLVLAGGLDRATLGERGWLRRIALVPQFHDNHIFFGPLGFNLLLGRGWPTSQEQLDEVAKLCRELGLGPTIDRMPDGLFQLIGETGWQLSHGERSRVFLARALLCGAPLVVLDESLAALDPDTLVEVIECIERRARAALVIAHP